MTRIYASPRKALILDVRRNSVIARGAKGRPTVRTFRNRYALRKFLSEKKAAAAEAGMVAVK